MNFPEQQERPRDAEPASSQHNRPNRQGDQQRAEAVSHGLIVTEYRFPCDFALNSVSFPPSSERFATAITSDYEAD
jgi:hypothetical protein